MTQQEFEIIKQTALKYQEMQKQIEVYQKAMTCLEDERCKCNITISSGKHGAVTLERDELDITASLYSLFKARIDGNFKAMEALSIIAPQPETQPAEKDDGIPF